MKKHTLVVTILSLMLFCSAASAEEKLWKNLKFVDREGVLVSDSFFLSLKAESALCQVDVMPDAVSGRAVDYSGSTEVESVEITDCFRIMDNHGVITITRKIGVLITTDESDKFVSEGAYRVFSEMCAEYAKGSNLPLAAQKALEKLE